MKKLVLMLLLLANCIASVAQTAEAWFKKGLETSDFQKKIEYYSNAITKNPYYVDAYRLRGTAYYELNRFKEAQADIVWVLKKDTANSDAYNVQGLLYMQGVERKKYSWSDYFIPKKFLNNDMARDAFDKAIRFSPKHADAYNNRGILNLHLKAYQAALQDFDSSLVYAPESASMHSNRGIALSFLNRNSEGMLAIHEALKYDSTFTYAYINRGMIYDTWGQQDAALQSYNTAIRLDSTLAHLYNNRAVVYKKLKKYDLSLQDAKKAIQLNSTNALFHLNKGWANACLEQHEAALKDFDTCLRLDSVCALAHQLRGKSLIQLFRAEEGLKAINKAIKLDPNQGTHYFERAKAYQELEKFQEAIRDCDTAIVHRSNFDSAYAVRGMLYYKLQNYNQALKDFDDAIRLNPEDAITYYNRGAVKIKLKQYEQAIPDYDKVLQLEAFSSSTHNHRGKCYLELKDCERALVDYDRGVSLEPNKSMVYNYRRDALECLTPDNQPPILELTSPIAFYRNIIRSVSNQEWTTQDSILEIRGKVIDYSGIKSLRINKLDIIINNDKSFEKVYILREGLNQIAINATDNAENSTVLILRITYNPLKEQHTPQKRLALVIGNGDYKGLPPLKQVVQDANALKNALDSLGFSVRMVLDADKCMLDSKISSFALEAKNYNVSLVYYLGYGFGQQGKNYLVPPDASTTVSAADIPYRLVSVDWLQHKIAEAMPPNSTNIVIMNGAQIRVPLEIWGRPSLTWEMPLNIPPYFVNDYITESEPQFGNHLRRVLRHLPTPHQNLDDFFKKVHQNLQEPPILTTKLTRPFYFKL